MSRYSRMRSKFVTRYMQRESHVANATHCNTLQHTTPLTEEIRLRIFRTRDLTIWLLDLLSDGDSSCTIENLCEHLGLPWKRVWYVRGLLWKLVRSFDSRNYFQPDLLRLGHTATHCNTLQHTATYCSTQQHLPHRICGESCRATVTVARNTQLSAEVCCSVGSVLQCDAVCCSVLKCVAVCCSVLQCVAVCCSVLQCVAVCCSVL